MVRRAHGRGRPRGKRPARERPWPERHKEGRSARAKGLIWTGAVSFGLVNIPVTLHSGENASGLGFSMLDRRDLAPVGYRKVNKSTGQELSSRDVVKGYKLPDGTYVTLSDADFKRASPERSQRIDIAAFVDAAAIDPAYYERPYLLEPAAKSEKAYALLREALRRSGRVGVASIVLHARQHLCALRADGDALRLELLRYKAQLRDPEELRLPAAKAGEAELRMAGRLIEDMSGPWEPERFRDEYREELLAFIERKAEAGEAEAGPPAPKEAAEAPPADIMGLLKRSLAGRERRAHANRG